MNAPNLAICVAPVIVTSVGSASFAGTMESMGRAQALVRDLIMQFEWFFEGNEEPEGDTAQMEQVIVTPGGTPEAGDSEESLERRPAVSI